MRWSELSPEQLEIELAKLGIDVGILTADIRDVPEQKTTADNLTSESARLRLALEWFGDKGHPQPVALDRVGLDRPNTGLGSPATPRGRHRRRGRRPPP